MTLASLVVKLTANAAEFHREMENVARRVERTGRMISRIGREISLAISLPILAAGFAAFHTLLADSARHFGPLFQAFDQLKASIRSLFLALGTELQPVFLQIIGLLRSGIATLRGWIDAFHELPAGIKQAVIYTLLFFAALGPTVLVVGKLVSAIGGLMKILPLLASGAGLATVAIIGLAAGGLYVATHWDKVKELLLEDLGAIVQGFFLAARGTVLAIDIMTLGITELIGVSSLLRSKLDALEDKTLGKLGGLIFNASEKLKGLKKGFDDLGGAGKSVQDIMNTLNDALRINEQRTEILGPRFNFLAGQAAAYGAAVDALTAMHVPLNTVLNAQGMTLAILGEKFQFISERAAEYARVIATFGPTSVEAAIAWARFQAAIASGKGFESATRQTEAFAAALKTTQAALIDGAAQGLAALGTQIGGILAGINNGFRGLGKALAGVLGTMLITIGQAAIAAGVAGIAIKKFLKSPAAAIAAGVALVAIGSALAATAQGAVDTAAGGGAGGGSNYSSSGSSAGSDQGPTTLVLRLESPDGLVDTVFRDPRNQIALARLIEELSGSQVLRIEQNTWNSNS